MPAGQAVLGRGGQGLLSQPVQIIVAPNGWISYQLPSPLTLPVGVQNALFNGQVKIDYGSGDVQHTSVFQLELQKSVGPTL